MRLSCSNFESVLVARALGAENAQALTFVFLRAKVPLEHAIRSAMGRRHNNDRDDIECPACFFSNRFKNFKSEISSQGIAAAEFTLDDIDRNQYESVYARGISAC